MVKLTDIVKEKLDTVDTIADLFGLVGSDGQQVSVASYHGLSDLSGGGTFVWSTGRHNGGTFIDPARAFPTDWSDQAQLEAWFADSGVDAGGWCRPDIANINVKWFGAKGDRISNDISALQSASSYASKHNTVLEFVTQDTYRLLGTNNLVFNSSTHFNNSTLDLESYSGRIELRTNSYWETFDSLSNVVTDLKTQTELVSTYWSGWLNTEEVSESFVKVNTSDPYYTYRGRVINRSEFNVVTRYGQVLSPLKYPLTTSAINSIDKLTINKYVTTYTDLVLKIGSNDSSNSFLVILDSTRIVVKNVSFITDDTLVHSTKNPTYVSIDNSYDVLFENVNFSFPSRSTATTGYTYNISMRGCYDVKLRNVVGQGDGWGATGSNLCQRVEFENCNLSRIDFHQPALEFLKITNCHIGSWGILVTMIGDLIITGGSFHIQQNAYVNNRGFIRSRSDMGGFCQGRLIMRDTKIFNYSSHKELYLCQPSQYNKSPTNTVLPYNFWEDILLDNVVSAGSHVVNLTQSAGLSYLKNSKTLTILNCKGSLVMDERDTGLSPAFESEGTVFPHAKANRAITVRNTNLSTLLTITNRSSSYFYKVIADGVSGADGSGVSFKLLNQGIVTITNSTLENLDFYSGGPATVPLYVYVDKCAIKHTGVYNDGCLNGWDATYNSVTIKDSLISVRNNDSLTGSGSIFKAKLENNKLSVNGGVMSTTYSLGSASSFSLPQNFNLDNKLRVTTGFDSLDTTRHIVVQAPIDANRSDLYYFDATNNVSVSSGLSRLDVTITAPRYRHTRLCL